MIGLKDQYADKFLIGAAVSKRSLEACEDIILKEFNSLTCENAMKFGVIHPQEDRYDFEQADAVADFARQHHLKMRGHTLVWHNQTSEWLFKDREGKPVTSECVYERLDAHMQAVMSRYTDVIAAWDVVNEAIDDKPEDFYRNSIWYNICGEAFIEKAFFMANQHAPNAALFYNDYNALVPGKRDKIIRMIRNLQEKDVPIHGVGLQGHLNIYTPDMDTVRASIEAYASLGLQIQITELDISLFQFDDRSVLDQPSAVLLEMQSDYYRRLFEVFREYQREISSVTLWGVTDHYSWLNHFPVKNRKNWPLLFDEQGRPKMCYTSIHP